MNFWELFEDKPYGLLKVIHEGFVCSLREFYAICQNLDTVHITHYQDFNNLIAGLIGPDPGMTGPGADSLAEKVAIYDQAEQEEMGYGPGGNLSARLAGIKQTCEQAADEVQLIIDTFVPALLPTERIIPVWTEELYISSGLGASNEMHLVSPAQLVQLEAMGFIRGNWASYLKSLDDENTSVATRLPSLQDARDLVMDIFNLPPVHLTPAQQKTLQQIMNNLAADGITGIPSAYIAALLADGLSQKDIMNAILAWHAQGMTDQQIADALFVAAFNATLSSYYNNGIPYGFTSQQQFQDFTSSLCSGLKSSSGVGGSGYCVSAGVGGSAVTGAQYKRGIPFDAGRQSDYDIVLSDPDLLAKAAAMGVPTYDNGLRTGPLDDNELRELGLYDLERQLTSKAGRPVHFLLYGSLVDDYSRSPYITFFNSSCSC
jgi:hypothetical protein